MVISEKFDVKEKILPKRERKTIRLERHVLDGETLLVEFTAPKQLVEAFDSKLKVYFSSRSEAIRSLMRAFINETK